MLAAVRTNSVHHVRRFKERGQGWSEAFQRKLCLAAVKYNSLDVLRYLTEQGCAWHEDASWLAVRNRHRDVLEHLHAHGCPWNTRVTDTCAEQGDLDLLKWVLARGCPWGIFTAIGAISNGDLQMLTYVHDWGCPIADFSIDEAAGCGALSCLAYLHEQGYPWSARTYAMASGYDSFYPMREGYPDVVRYLHEHGCPMSEESLVGLARDERAPSSQLECVRFMLAQGCPAEQRARLVRLVVRRLLLPRWRWMVKVRPYALHWLEEHEKAQCAPDGAGKKRDRDAFEADFVA